MNTSAKGDISQPVRSQAGKVMVKVYDWTNFLTVKKLVGIKKSHQFKMSSAQIGWQHAVTINDKLELGAGLLKCNLNVNCMCNELNMCTYFPAHNNVIDVW